MGKPQNGLFMIGNVTKIRMIWGTPILGNLHMFPLMLKQDMNSYQTKVDAEALEELEASVRFSRKNIDYNYELKFQVSNV